MFLKLGPRDMRTIPRRLLKVTQKFSISFWVIPTIYKLGLGGRWKTVGGIYYFKKWTYIIECKIQVES